MTHNYAIYGGIRNEGRGKKREKRRGKKGETVLAFLVLVLM